VAEKAEQGCLLYYSVTGKSFQLGLW